MEKDKVEEVTLELEKALSHSCSCSSSDDPMIVVPPYEFTAKEKKDHMASEEFKDGLKKGAYLGGIYTSLVNSGFDVMVAMEIAVGLVSLDKSKEIQLAMAKVVTTNKEKDEI